MTIMIIDDWMCPDVTDTMGASAPNYPVTTAFIHGDICYKTIHHDYVHKLVINDPEYRRIGRKKKKGKIKNW